MKEAESLFVHLNALTSPSTQLKFISQELLRDVTSYNQ